MSRLVTVSLISCIFDEVTHSCNRFSSDIAQPQPVGLVKDKDVDWLAFHCCCLAKTFDALE